MELTKFFLFPVDLVGSIVQEIIIIEHNKNRYTTQEFYKVVWRRLVERFPQLVPVNESISHHPDDLDRLEVEYGYAVFEFIKEIIAMRDQYYKGGK
jgi:hypothetical protein